MDCLINIWVKISLIWIVSIVCTQSSDSQLYSNVSLRIDYDKPFNGIIFSKPQTRCPPIPPVSCDAKSRRYRTFDGTCNNPIHINWGQLNKCVVRFLPADYGADPSGQTSIRAAKDGKPLPNERKMSNVYFKDRGVSHSRHSLMMMQFGQFITEDITHVTEPRRYAYDYQIGESNFPCCALTKPNLNFCSPIYIDPNDEFYRQYNVTCINNFRSLPCPQCDGEARLQVNQRTPFVDLSGIYSESVGNNLKLRTLSGGLLKISKDARNKISLLPRMYDPPDPKFPPDTADSCEPKYDSVCFMTGDSPANQQPGLATLHTLFHRQHNRIASALALVNPHYNDDTLFEETRHILIAQMQHIIYSQYLPRVLGPAMMAKHNLFVSSEGYTQFNPTVDPTLILEWSSAAFRFGHSTIQDKFLHVSNDGRKHFSQLREQFFHPAKLYEGEYPSLLRGLTQTPQAEVDPFFVDAVRNHLYQPFDKQHGFDLPTLNTRRGREHGLRGYVHYIRKCDGVIIKSFPDLDAYMEKSRWIKLSQIYVHVEDIDLYVGGLSERHLEGGIVGPTFACIIATQFERLKFGDRFYYEHGGHDGALTPGQLAIIRKTTLSGLLCSNDVQIPSMQINALDLIDDDKNSLIPCALHFDITKYLAMYWKTLPRTQEETEDNRRN